MECQPGKANHRFPAGFPGTATEKEVVMEKTCDLSRWPRCKCWSSPRTLLAVLALSAAAAGNGAVLAQGAGEPLGPPTVSPASPTAPPEIFKPTLPSELQSADRVFKELDIANRGYLTLDDTKNLIGFEKAFKAEDSKGSGMLTLPQFRRAWTIYTRKQ